MIVIYKRWMYLLITMALTLEDMMVMAFTMEETTTISVQMLTGDVFPVRIRLTDPVGLFPKQFANQHGLHSRMVKRFRFYLSDIDADCSMDEEVPLSHLRSVHLTAEGVTWKEKYPVGLPDRLYLSIQDDSEEEQHDKVRLIRWILKKKGWNDSMGDAQLWGEYLYWMLYAQNVEEGNRLQTLTTFVESQAHLFVGMEME